MDSDTNGDGILDAEELATLLVSLNKFSDGLIKPIVSADVARDGSELLQAQIRRLDAHKQGGLDFGQFLHLLQMPPWKDLVPDTVKDQLHFVGLKYGRENNTKPASKRDQYPTAHPLR